MKPKSNKPAVVNTLARALRDKSATYNPTPMVQVAQWLSDKGLAAQAKHLRWAARAAASPHWRGFRLTEATLRVRLKNAYEVVRFLDQSQFNGVDGIAGVRAKLETAMEDAATAIKLHIADPDTKHPVEKGQSNLSNMSDQRLTARVRELVLHPGASMLKSLIRAHYDRQSSPDRS